MSVRSQKGRKIILIFIGTLCLGVRRLYPNIKNEKFMGKRLSLASVHVECPLCANLQANQNEATSNFYLHTAKWQIPHKY